MKTILILLAGLSGLGLASETPAPESPPKGLAASDWSSIRAAYEAGRHAANLQEDGTLTARNPGQQWRTEFDGKGFTVTPDHGQWTWGLELTGYGERTLLSAPNSLTHEGGKIICQRDENLTEWFINDTRGLEQGWTIHSRSVGSLPAIAESDGRVSPTSENLTLTLAVHGDLSPQVSPGSSSVSFQTASGGTALTYGGLKAWDADGKTLTVRFEPAGENAIRIAVEEQNARYPITIDPIAQQAYLKASNTGAGDIFGTSVAVSGDTVVVGAFGEDSSTTGVNSTPNESASGSGAAYVFTRSGSTWSQQAYLKASNTGTTDQFGYSVSVSGDTVVVGAQVEYSSTTGVNSTPNENAPGAGAAYVFTRSGTTWSQQAYLKASNTGANDRFGNSVAVSGDTVVVGAEDEGSSTTGVNSTPNENASTSGAAYVFTRSGTTWSQQAYLKASNTGASDAFGWSVAVSGDTVVVGARQEDSSTTGVNSTPNDTGGNAFNSGAAYVFTLPPPPTVAITAVSPDPRTATVTTMTITFNTPVQNFDLSDLTLTRDNGPNLINGSFSLATAENTLFTLTVPAAVTTPGGNYRLAVLVSNIVDLGGVPLGFGGEEQWLTLPTNLDTDGDGFNDASEFNMAALGFDWQVSQPGLVATYRDNANSVGYYSLSQVQALNTGTPLIQKNPATGKFKLTMDWKKSTNLSDFLDFPAPVGSGVSINPQGDVELEFPSTDNAAFYRIEVE